MKIILVVGLVLVLASPAHPLSHERDENGELLREINVLNLINGLNLTEDQAGELLRHAKDAKAIRDSERSEYDSVKNDLRAALTSLRDGLYGRDSRPSQEIERRAAELHRSVLRRMEETGERLRRVEERVAAALTAGQAEIVRNFKPCLIPPKNLKNPVKAGQAFDSSRAERALEMARSAPEARYVNARHRIVDGHLERMEKHLGRMSEAERGAKAALLLETFDRARGMSDEEFALNRRDLALQIDPDGTGRERRELRNGTRFERPRMGPGRIGWLLLDEKAIPILEKWLQSSQRQGHTGSGGLQNIKNGDQGEYCALTASQGR